MGMDLNIYYGPVFKIKVFGGEFEKNINTCSNVDCKKHGLTFGGSKFCPECGSPIESIAFKKYYESDGLENLLDEYRDLAVPLGEENPVEINGKKYKIYIPNYRFSEHEIKVPLDEGGFYKPISQMKFEKIMEDFLSHDFTKEILGEYKRHIPDQNIEFEFAMFAYYN
jgi:hypothetical protein